MPNGCDFLTATASVLATHILLLLSLSVALSLPLSISLLGKHLSVSRQWPFYGHRFYVQLITLASMFIVFAFWMRIKLPVLPVLAIVLRIGYSKLVCTVAKLL